MTYLPDWLTYGWLIDEFDGSFDHVAQAVLRTALDVDDSLTKARAMLAEYESLWDRATSRGAAFAEHYNAAHQDTDLADWLNSQCDECDRIHAERDAEEAVFCADQKALRHRFVDLAPSLPCGEVSGEPSLDDLVASFDTVFDTVAARSLTYHLHEAVALLPEKAADEARRLLDTTRDTQWRHDFVEIVPALWS